MKSNFRSFTKDVKTIFSESSLKSLGERVGAVAFHTIQERSSKGKFIGGYWKDKGYSENPISAWKLGDVTYLGKGKKRKNAIMISVKKPTIRAVTFKRDEIRWGKGGAVILGGYKEFRKKSGREHNFVSLTLTGRMWNAFRYRVGKEKRNVSILFSFNPAQERKAFYTNKGREFMGLTDSEFKELSVIINNEIESRLSEI